VTSLGSPAPSDEPILIPAELLPDDGRFGSGPSKVRANSVVALAEGAPTYLGTSHRQPGVRSVVGRIRSGLAELFGLPEGYRVVLGNGGATAFWDVATFCLIERRSEHLSFGEFSSRFAATVAAAPHLEPPEVLESPPGTHPAPVAMDDIDTYALTHNETSTGVSMEINRPEGAASGALVVVDGTSAAGGLRFDPAQADAYYFSPQKCFAADGGLWAALLSPAAAERARRIAAGGRWVPPSLDLLIAMENSANDQTYNTPALATLFLFADQLEWLLTNGGLEWAASRCDRSAEILYGWAEASEYAAPFVAKPDERSHVVGTVDFDPKVDAAAVARTLRANGILDTEPYRKLGRNQLRVGLYPAIEPGDVAALTTCVDYVVSVLSG
jgi:phosphoserine aminotransferase